MTNINLPALEKRFQLSSKDLGLIPASNDISAIVLISFVSFYGEFGNKIKWLGYGMLITGQLQWRIALQGFLSPKSSPPPPPLHPPQSYINTLSEKRTVFRESSSRKTVRFEGQIMSKDNPCIRRLRPQYKRQSKLSCPTETTR